MAQAIEKAVDLLKTHLDGSASTKLRLLRLYHGVLDKDNIGRFFSASAVQAVEALKQRFVESLKHFVHIVGTTRELGLVYENNKIYAFDRKSQDDAPLFQLVFLPHHEAYVKDFYGKFYQPEDEFTDKPFAWPVDLVPNPYAGEPPQSRQAGQQIQRQIDNLNFAAPAAGRLRFQQPKKQQQKQKKQQGRSVPCTPQEYYDLFYKIVQQ